MSNVSCFGMPHVRHSIPVLRFDGRACERMSPEAFGKRYKAWLWKHMQAGSSVGRYLESLLEEEAQDLRDALVAGGGRKPGWAVIAKVLLDALVWLDEALEEGI